MLGCACLLLVAAAAVLDLRPLIVAGSSMEPSLPVGSLAIARSTPAAALEPGAVVSVERDDGSRVTHRVVDLSVVDPTDGTMSMTLQGDANPGPDPRPHVAATADLVVGSVPLVGRWMTALDSPWAVFVAGALAGWACWAAGTETRRRTRAVLWIDDVPYRVS